MFRLAQLSLGNRALIALITVFAAVFGVITMGSLKQELIPSLEFPYLYRLPVDKHCFQQHTPLSECFLPK